MSSETRLTEGNARIPINRGRSPGPESEKLVGKLKIPKVG